MASQITGLTIVYSTVYRGADQRKHQSSASLAWVRGIHQSPVNSPHKWPVTRKMFPFDYVIMSPDSPSSYFILDILHDNSDGHHYAADDNWDYDNNDNDNYHDDDNRDDNDDNNNEDDCDDDNDNMMNFRRFLASDWSSSCHAFGDKPVIWLSSDLVGKLIKVLHRPDLLTFGYTPWHSCRFLTSLLYMRYLVTLLLPSSQCCFSLSCLSSYSLNKQRKYYNPKDNASKKQERRLKRLKTIGGLWDRYTAPNSKCIGAPPPPPQKKKKKKEEEKIKGRNTIGCLDQYAAQNSKYARLPIPSQPTTQNVFFQWHTQYDPTMKHSHCETVYAKKLFQWLFFELAHSLRIL